jgi:hypothetical protein
LTAGQEQCSIGHLYVNAFFIKGINPRRGIKESFVSEEEVL